MHHWGPIHTKDARFFCCGNWILLRIYQNPIHLNGARWRTTFFCRRTSCCLQNLVRQRSHLNVWDLDISAAEFPQQKKTRVFGVNRPLIRYCSSIKTLQDYRYWEMLLWRNVIIWAVHLVILLMIGCFLVYGMYMDYIIRILSVIYIEIPGWILKNSQYCTM